jgi:hypothetical protein
VHLAYDIFAFLPALIALAIIFTTGKWLITGWWDELVERYKDWRDGF